MTVLASSWSGWMEPSPRKCHQPPATLLSSIPATSLLPPSPALPCPWLHPAAAQLHVTSRSTPVQMLPVGAGGEKGHRLRGLQAATTPCPPPLIIDTVVSLPPHHCLSHRATSPSAVRGSCAEAGTGCGQAASWCRQAQAGPAWPWMSHLRSHMGEQTTHPIHLTWKLLDLR